MTRLTAALVAAALLLPTGARAQDTAVTHGEGSQWTTTDNGVIANLPTEPQTLEVYDKDGKVVFAIDTKTRTITVPAGVNVSKIARLVITAMKPMLSGLCQ